MFWIDVISRITHVSCAIVLVGGAAFQAFALLPSVSALPDEQRQGFIDRLTAAWKRFVHVGVLLFLVSGLYNYMQAIPNHKGDGLYHALLGTKMLIALVIFFLASALVGKSKGLQFIRDKRAMYLKLMLVLATVIVCISGFAKIRGVPVDDTTPSAEVSNS